MSLAPSRTRRGEELVNGLTHGVGLALSLAGAPLLVVLAALRGTVWQLAGVSVYGASLVALYACSTLYHSLQTPPWKAIFRVADHSAIHLLIAGTYTPFTLVNLHGPWGWFLLVTVWGLSLVGIGSKLFVSRHVGWLSITLYLVTGWLVVIAIKPVLHHVAFGGILWLAAGGLCYTFGLIFFAWERCPYNHAVWHTFVLAGSACHYVAVLRYVLPVSV